MSHYSSFIPVFALAAEPMGLLQTGKYLMWKQAEKALPEASSATFSLFVRPSVVLASHTQWKHNSLTYVKVLYVAQRAPHTSSGTARDCHLCCDADPVARW